jgi:hypothetical protein
MQTGEIVRIHHTTLTSEFDLGDQGLIVFFRCGSLDIRCLSLHLLLAYLLARAAVERGKVTLEVEEDSETKEAHGEGDVTEDPFGDGGVLRVWTLFEPVRLTGELDDAFGFTRVGAEDGDELGCAAAVSYTLSDDGNEIP